MYFKEVTMDFDTIYATDNLSKNRLGGVIGL
jgi:hypothetical protein